MNSLNHPVTQLLWILLLNAFVFLIIAFNNFDQKLVNSILLSVLGTDFIMMLFFNIVPKRCCVCNKLDKRNNLGSYYCRETGKVKHAHYDCIRKGCD